MDLRKTGRTIALLRKESGLTQAQLAEKLRVSDKAVSKWERGISCPDVSIWNKLSILLDTDIENLIYGHEDKSEWKGILFLRGTVPPGVTVFNKPLIHYLLSQFLLVGICDVAVIGTCGCVSLPGVRIQIVDSLSQLNHWFTRPVFLIYGNRFLYGPNLTRHLKRAMSRTDGITVLASLKGKGQYPIAVDSDRRAGLTEELTANQYYAEPFVFIPEKTRLSPYDHFEDFIREHNFNAETMSRGIASFDIRTFEDAFRLSEYVSLMEGLTGERIGCVEELLLRRGLADYENVKEICDKETKRYLERLFR